MNLIREIILYFFKDYILNLYREQFLGSEDRMLGSVRSSKWPRVRKEHIEKYPACALCGSKELVEVHHKKPFHLFPELELDPKNLITLCESGKNGIVCHRAIGHLGNYRSYNAEVEKDTTIWKEKIINRP